MLTQYTSAAIESEVMRIARNEVKLMIRASGQKIGCFRAGEITKACKALVKAKPELLVEAERNLAEREKATENVNVSKTLRKLFA
jgi:hypothetical protein